MSKYHSKNNVCARNNVRRPSMEAVLHNAGVNTTDYLSLRINKADLPANAELVIQIRDKQTGALIPVNLNDEANELFGKNSRFYGKVMQDGHVFNPYIHRRFIAAQFRDLVRRFGMNGIQQHAASVYDWKYAIDQVRKECQKLALLERRDKAAFAERSCFFTVSAVADFLSDYVTEICHFLNRSVAQWRSDANTGYIHGFGYVERNHLRPIRHRYECLRDSARQCRTHAELSSLISAFDFAELPRRTSLPASFVIPFLEAGAYYTMKHSVMFEGKTIYGKSQKESLDLLLSVARSGRYDACRTLYAQAHF